MKGIYIHSDETCELIYTDFTPDKKDKVFGYICKTHNVETSRLGIEWRDYHKIYKEKWEQNWKNNILGYCVMCGKVLTHTKERYRTQGNYCYWCNRMVIKVVQELKSRKELQEAIKARITANAHKLHEDFQWKEFLKNDMALVRQLTLNFLLSLRNTTGT